MLGLRSPLAFAFLSSFLLFACSETSQITVEVDHAQRPAGASVHITVQREGGDTEVFREQSPAEWPVSLAVVPKDDDISGVVVATAKVTIDGEEFTQEARTPFHRGQNIVLRMEFGESIEDPDGGAAPDGSVPDGGIDGPDAGRPDCTQIMDPEDPEEIISAQAVAGHSHRTPDGSLHHWLLISTARDLLLYTRDDTPRSCFEHVASIAPPTSGWSQHIDLGWDGQHLIIAATTSGGVDASVFATFAVPGAEFPLPEVVFNGEGRNITVGGASASNPLRLPFVAAFFEDGRFLLSFWSDPEWVSDESSRLNGTDIAGLADHLIVANAMDGTFEPRFAAWRVRWSGTTPVRSPTAFDNTHPYTAGGRTPAMPGGNPGTPWAIVAAPDDDTVHRFRQTETGWTSWGSNTIGRLAGNRPNLLDGNHSHWLAVIRDPEGSPQDLAAVWGPIDGWATRTTPIESALGVDSLSIAVFPFGFVYLTEERTVRVHMQGM